MTWHIVAKKTEVVKKETATLAGRDAMMRVLEEDGYEIVDYSKWDNDKK